MTWLSRLLPQSPSLQRLADHNHRTRRASAAAGWPHWKLWGAARF